MEKTIHTLALKGKNIFYGICQIRIYRETTYNIQIWLNWIEFSPINMECSFSTCTGFFVVQFINLMKNKMPMSCFRDRKMQRYENISHGAMKWQNTCRLFSIFIAEIKFQVFFDLGVFVVYNGVEFLVESIQVNFFHNISTIQQQNCFGKCSKVLNSKLYWY